MKGRRVLHGCVIGCGGMLVVGLIAIIAFVVWLRRPGDVLDTDLLLDEGTVGYVDWTMTREDPGTAAFAASLIESLNNLPDESPDWVPGPMRQWMVTGRNRAAKDDIEKLFPSTVGWTLSAGDGPDDDLYVFTVSAASFGNQLVLFDMFGGMGSRFVGNTRDFATEKYQGERLYAIADPDEDLSIAGFIRGTHLFVTSDMPTARRAVDRLDADTPAQQNTTFGALLGQVPDAPLRGAIWNGDGALTRLLADDGTDDIEDAVLDELQVERPGGLEQAVEPTAVAWDSVEALRFHGAFVERDFEVVLRFDCPDQGCRRSGLPRRIQELADDTRDWSVELQFETREDADGLEWTCRTVGLLDALESGSWAESVDRQFQRIEDEATERP